MCFGAKNDSFGSFNVPYNGTILTFELVYKSGYVTCNANNLPYGSHWACKKQEKIGTIITNAENKVIFPPNDKNTSFMLPGYHRNLPKLIYHLSPQMVEGGEECRIWYHEGYRNQNENDNAGSTCTDVYALYNWLHRRYFFWRKCTIYTINVQEICQGYIFCCFLLLSLLMLI